MRCGCGCALRGVVVTLLLVGSGCAGGSKARMSEVYTAYNSGQYQTAFQRAGALAESGSRKTSQEAAYMAGLSAYRMENLTTATHYLRRAAAARDSGLAGDAYATLGLVYAQQGDSLQAARAFARAAKLLTGEDQANAYYYAAVSAQKTGQWSQGRSYLMLARSATESAETRERIAQALSTTGFTLQTGFYALQANAEREAQRIAPKAAQLSMGYPRVVPATDGRGQPGYLVQVGQYSSYASATSARQRFGEPMAMIVPLTR